MVRKHTLIPDFNTDNFIKVTESSSSGERTDKFYYKEKNTGEGYLSSTELQLLKNLDSLEKFSLLAENSSLYQSVLFAGSGKEIKMPKHLIIEMSDEDFYANHSYILREFTNIEEMECFINIRLLEGFRIKEVHIKDKIVEMTRYLSAKTVVKD